MVDEGKLQISFSTLTRAQRINSQPIRYLHGSWAPRELERAGRRCTGISKTDIEEVAADAGGAGGCHRDGGDGHMEG